MAVANSKSGSILALDDTPKRRIDSYKHNGPLKISKDNVEVVVADDDGSVYRMVRVRSNISIKELNVLNDAIANGTDYDLGVYDTADNGGAVVDPNLFSSVINMSAARTLPLNALFESGEIDIDEGDQRLWELLGLSSDSNKEYDICFTANTVGSAVGTIALECVWSQ